MLPNVDSELVVVSEYAKLEKFGGDETKTELGAVTPKDLVNDEIDYGYQDMFAGVFTNNAEQHSSLESRCRVIDVMLKGRGKKIKKKTGNPCESLASESDKGKRV